MSHIREIQPLSPDMESLTQGFTPEGGDYIYLPDTGYPSKDPSMRDHFSSWIRTLDDNSKHGIFEIMATSAWRELDYGDPYLVRDASKQPRFLKVRMFIASVKRGLTKPS